MKIKIEEPKGYNIFIFITSILFVIIGGKATLFNGYSILIMGNPVTVNGIETHDIVHKTILILLPLVFAVFGALIARAVIKEKVKLLP